MACVFIKSFAATRTELAKSPGTHSGTINSSITVQYDVCHDETVRPCKKETQHRPHKSVLVVLTILYHTNTNITVIARPAFPCWGRVVHRGICLLQAVGTPQETARNPRLSQQSWYRLI